MIGYQAALIYTMVLTAAADRDLTDAETRRMGAIIRNLPVFAGFHMEELSESASACLGLLEDEDGIEKALDAVSAALPQRLHETAYALACDVAAADGAISQETLRMLELVRHHLQIDRLIAAGIERGARARFTVYTPQNKN